MVSRPWSRDSSAFCPGLGLSLKTWWSGSQSRSQDLKSKVSVSVWRPDGPGLGLSLKTWWSRSQSRSQDLKSKVSVSRPDGPGLGLCLETSSPRSQSWDLKAQVSVSVSRPEVQGLGLETWWPRLTMVNLISLGLKTWRPRPGPSGLETETLAFRSRDRDLDKMHLSLET